MKRRGRTQSGVGIVILLAILLCMPIAALTAFIDNGNGTVAQWTTTTSTIYQDCLIGISVTPPEGGTTSPTGSIFLYGCSPRCISVQAIPNSGYSFKHWEGAAEGTVNPINVCIPEGSGTAFVTAVFEFAAATTTTTTTTIISTLIELSSFTTNPYNKAVTLSWSTETETQNAGFNLYRADSEDGNYSKINDTFIPAKGAATQGASYEFIDKDVKNRKTYYYKLEDIDLSGKSTMHGPVSATPRFIFGFRD